MVELLLGQSGSGKTTLITKRIADDLKNGCKVILLVPEQMAVNAESAICSESQSRGIPQTDLEILNFKRLCNRVFREYGGIAYNTVSGGAKALLMWEVLFSVAPHLKQYGTEVEDAKMFIPALLSSMDELKAYNITPDMLESASKQCHDENIKLSEKLSDLAIIASAYKMRLTNGFDDPSDDLTKLSKTLSVNKFFQGKRVYIDSFVGFTPQELSVIKYIMRQADNVCVSLTYSDTNHAYEPVTDTLNKLKTCASSSSQELRITNLDGYFRYKNEELSFLADNLWNFNSSKIFGEKTEVIRTFTADNIYEEVDYIACDILSKVRSGARYKDFAVIAGNTSDYAGILDTAFQRYGLPCHFSKDILLSEKPIFKLILSALRIRSFGWKTDDVIAFIKTGLLPISPIECDEIEAYASSWSIIGRTWYDENDWQMNPDGYSEKMTEESKELLERLNKVRKKFTPPLRKFFESLDRNSTIKCICSSLYSMLRELSVHDMISKNGTDDDIRVWNCLCDSLDILVTLCPDRKADDKLFSGLLTLVINQTSFGSLPVLCDEIIFGSADLIRTSGVKHTYLIGVNDGIFPAANNENGFFTDGEKDILEGYDIFLSPKSDDSTLRELFNFYTAACSPSETLTVTRYISELNGKQLKSSLGFDRIKALFPNAEHIKTSDIPLDFKIQNISSSLELAHSIRNTSEGKALEQIFKNDTSFSQFFDTNRQPLVSTIDILSEDLRNKTFGNTIGLTQSRLESYVMCPFDYACHYQLKLKEKRSSQFNAADIGTLIHYILECFFRKISSESTDIKNITDNEIDNVVSNILNDYLKTIFGLENGAALTSRALQLFLRLKRAVKCIIKNFAEELAQSSFVPTFFEMPINMSGDENTVAPLQIPLAGGCKAFIYGVVDRVDICRRGDDVLVRVVDYKTGKKEFSMSDIAAGLNLQMLLYLFSIWHDESGTFRKATDCKGDIIPAGVLYAPAKPASSSDKVTTNSSPEEIYRAVSEKLLRKGLLIDDEEILRMMESELAGKFIPISCKDDVIKPSKSTITLMSLSELGKLESQISDTVASLAEEMRSGNFSAKPRLNNSDKPERCRYCPHKAVCRSPFALDNDDEYDIDDEYDESEE